MICKMTPVKQASTKISHINLTNIEKSKFSMCKNNKTLILWTDFRLLLNYLLYPYSVGNENDNRVIDILYNSIKLQEVGFARVEVRIKRVYIVNIIVNIFPLGISIMDLRSTPHYGPSSILTYLANVK